MRLPAPLASHSAQSGTDVGNSIFDVAVTEMFGETNMIWLGTIGGSAITPASAARNCAVDRRIAEPIGVTDVRVQ